MTALRAGIPRAVFWDLSPRELEREFQAAALRQQDGHDRDVVLAWHVVRVYAMALKQKRVPELATLLRRPARRPVPQTLAEQRAALELLSSLYGGAVRSGAAARSEEPMTKRLTKGRRRGR